MAGNSDLVDIEMRRFDIRKPMERSILASTTGEFEDAVVLPLSLIEVEPTKGNMVMVTMPQWLAEDRGLV